MTDKLKELIVRAPWSRLPAPIWALVASPLLDWVMGFNITFKWPPDCSKLPWKLSFWYVAASKIY